MNWYLWFLVAWFLLGAVMVVANVGKPRKPTTPDIAAIIVVIDALLIAGIFVFGAR